MKNEELDLLLMNSRVLMLLGIATAMLIDVKRSRPRMDHYKYDWLMEAVNEVVYKGNPIPPMPEET